MAGKQIRNTMGMAHIQTSFLPKTERRLILILLMLASPSQLEPEDEFSHYVIFVIAYNQ
jgi:hypothetical protein